MNKMLITYNNLKDKTTDELILIKNQYIRTYIGDFIKPWDYIYKLSILDSLINKI